MDAINKYKIVEKIIATEDDSILEEIKLLPGIDSDSKNSWDAVPDSVRQTLERSFIDIKEGKISPNEEVMTDIKKRFLKDF